MGKSMILGFIIVICFPSNTYTQLAFGLKITPQNVFHPYTPIFPVGFELTSGNFGIEYEHGFKTKPLEYDLKLTAFNQTYFRSRLGIRQYLNTPNIKQFLGIYVSYLPYRYQKNNGWYKKGDETYKYESSEINIQYFKFNFYYGLKLPIHKSFNFEFLTGIGYKHKKVSHQTTGEYLTEDLWSSGIPKGWIDIDRKAGSFYKPSLLFNFRLEYLIYQQKN